MKIQLFLAFVAVLALALFAPRPERARVAVSGPHGLEVALTVVDGRVELTRSGNRGATWSAPLRLSQVPGAKTLSACGLVLDGDGAYAAWKTGVARDVEEVFFTRVDLRGPAPAVDVPETRVPTGHPFGTGKIRDWNVVASRGTRANLVFAVNVDPSPLNRSEELYTVSSHDGGRSLSQPVFVPRWEPQAFDVDHIDLAADGDDVYLVWDDDCQGSGGDDTFLDKSTDGGDTWGALGAPRRLDTREGGDTEDAVYVLVRGERVHVAWGEELRGAELELRARLSVDGGRHFGPEEALDALPRGLPPTAERVQLASAGRTAQSPACSASSR